MNNNSILEVILSSADMINKYYEEYDEGTTKFSRILGIPDFVTSSIVRNSDKEDVNFEKPTRFLDYPAYMGVSSSIKDPVLEIIPVLNYKDSSSIVNAIVSIVPITIFSEEDFNERIKLLIKFYFNFLKKDTNMKYEPNFQMIYLYDNKSIPTYDITMIMFVAGLINIHIRSWFFVENVAGQTSVNPKTIIDVLFEDMRSKFNIDHKDSKYQSVVNAMYETMNKHCRSLEAIKESLNGSLVKDFLANL